jgi:hypothetical protein
MAKTKETVEVLNYLNEIVDLCVGNIPADDIGVDAFSTLPEAMAKIQIEPSNRNAAKAGLKYIRKLKSKVVFLEETLERIEFQQERGIIR